MIMKLRQCLLSLFIIFAVFAAAGCSGSPVSKPVPEKPSTEKVIIKVAHTTSTDYPYHIGLQEMAKSLSAKTAGQAELQIFPSGQLGGNELELVKMMQLGDISMTVVNGAILSEFSPKAEVFNLPFIFRDYNHLYKVLDGEPGRIISADLEKKNLKVLTWYVNPERYIFTTKKPVSSLPDLKGLKIRVTQNPVASATFSSLGAVPTPMSYGELYPALQQGVIDGGENDWFGIRGMKFYEVAPQIALTGHFMVACPLLISLQWYNILTPELQKALQESANDGTTAMRRYMEQNLAQARQDLESKNIKITKIKDIEAWHKAVEPVYAKFETQIGKDLIDMVKNIQ